MKNIIKLFFNNSVLFLVGFLALLSCDSNKDRYESYNFYAEIHPVKDIYVGKAGEIEIVIRADNYKDGISHEVSYTDNKNSELINNSTEEIIKKNDTFIIPDVDKKYIYKFISDEKGLHNLKFSFKNSKGYTFSQGIVIDVKEE